MGLTIDVQIRVCPPAFLHCVMHHEHHVYTDACMYVYTSIESPPPPNPHVLTASVAVFRDGTSEDVKYG